MFHSRPHAGDSLAMDLILHHYDFSNFSEKVRLVLGLKDFTWYSVEIPAYQPKPDYTPLTGGYRRTPALQLGADIDCDTALIVNVLEQLRPTPPLYPGPDPDRSRALSESLTAWAESQLMRSIALYITGVHAKTFPPEFHADRAALHRKSTPSLAQVEASAATYLPQVWPQVARIEGMFSAGQDYVLGDAISLADISIYEAVWFIETIGGHCERLDTYLKTRAWMSRVARIGHGERHELAAGSALDQALHAEPEAVKVSDYCPPEDVRIGDTVIITPLNERSPASGTLAYIDAERLTLRTHHDHVGEVCVHFPRLGYRLRQGGR